MRFPFARDFHLYGISLYKPESRGSRNPARPPPGFFRRSGSNRAPQISSSGGSWSEDLSDMSIDRPFNGGLGSCHILCKTSNTFQACASVVLTFIISFPKPSFWLAWSLWGIDCLMSRKTKRARASSEPLGQGDIPPHLEEHLRAGSHLS